MSDATPSSAPPAAPPAKKRHPVERALVWIGILALLAVVGWEWCARTSYEHSMQALEEAVTKGGDENLTLEAAQRHIHGYAVRTEGQHLKMRLITLQWPSLFKEYKLNLALDNDNIVRAVETVLPEADAMAPLPAETISSRSAPAADPAMPDAAANATPADAAPADAAAPATEAAQQQTP